MITWPRRQPWLDASARVDCTTAGVVLLGIWNLKHYFYSIRVVVGSNCSSVDSGSSGSDSSYIVGVVVVGVDGPIGVGWFGLQHLAERRGKVVMKSLKAPKYSMTVEPAPRFWTADLHCNVFIHTEKCIRTYSILLSCYMPYCSFASLLLQGKRDGRFWPVVMLSRLAA